MLWRKMISDCTASTTLQWYFYESQGDDRMELDMTRIFVAGLYFRVTTISGTGFMQIRMIERASVRYESFILVEIYAHIRR